MQISHARAGRLGCKHASLTATVRTAPRSIATLSTGRLATSTASPPPTTSGAATRSPCGRISSVARPSCGSGDGSVRTAPSCGSISLTTRRPRGNSTELPGARSAAAIGPSPCRTGTRRARMPGQPMWRPPAGGTSAMREAHEPRPPEAAPETDPAPSPVMPCVYRKTPPIDMRRPQQHVSADPGRHHRPLRRAARRPADRVAIRRPCSATRHPLARRSHVQPPARHGPALDVIRRTGPPCRRGHDPGDRSDDLATRAKSPSSLPPAPRRSSLLRPPRAFSTSAAGGKLSVSVRCGAPTRPASG